MKSLIFVLKRAPAGRSAAELGFLSEVFSETPFFQSFQQEFGQAGYEQLLRNLRYEFGRRDRKVLNMGELGRKFYIILSGSVSVLIPRQGSESGIGEEEQGNTEFIEVNELGSGDCFGEIALLNSVPRTASCVCKEETHLGVLTAETYMKIVGFYGGRD